MTPRETAGAAGPGPGWEGLRPGLPPAGRPPPPREPHLWVVARNDDPACWAGLLAPEDAAYVARHRRAEDRQTTSISRGLLRLLLAHYLSMDPSEVPLRRHCQVCGAEGHGRPEVLGRRLAVSVTHGGDWVVAAAVSLGAVGVDLEPASPVQDPDELAAAVLAPEELVRWRADPSSSGGDAVLRAWVRKEALVKAVGLGLAIDPTEIDVSGSRADVPLRAGSSAQVVHLRDVGAPGHAAALACTAPIGALHTFRVARGHP